MRNFGPSPRRQQPDPDRHQGHEIRKKIIIKHSLWQQVLSVRSDIGGEESSPVQWTQTVLHHSLKPHKDSQAQAETVANLNPVLVIAVGHPAWPHEEGT